MGRADRHLLLPGNELTAPLVVVGLALCGMVFNAGRRGESLASWPGSMLACCTTVAADPVAWEEQSG